MNEVLELVFSTSFAFSVLRLTTPILLAALASVISERAGIGNITMEGTMLISAFMGVVVSAYTGSAWLGFLGGVVIGGLTGWLLSYIIFTLQVNVMLAPLVLMIPYVVTLIAMCVYAYFRLQRKKKLARKKA